MKRLLSLAVISSTLALGACSKQETPPPAPAITPPANTAPASTAPAAPPATPTQPAMPAPNPSSSDNSPGPKPGQVNDHSSPEFKEGGKK